MRYQILHQIVYRYDRPTVLDLHRIQMRPMGNVTQSLRQFALQISPLPELLVENVELEGNSVLRAWFSEQPTTELSIQMTAEVETHRQNPFLFRLDPSAVTLPIDYPADRKSVV